MKPRFLLWLSIAFVGVLNVNAQEVSTNSADNVVNNHNIPLASPYFLQHQYLSVIAPMVGENDGSIFETPTVLNSVSTIGNGFRSPFADDDIKVEKIVVDGKNIFVWRFPEPEFLREALYMAFIPVDGKYMAYAICVGQRVDWEISTSNEKSRSTFGRVKKPDNSQECVDLLIKRGALTGTISPGEFIQEGYNPPKYR